MEISWARCSAIALIAILAAFHPRIEAQTPNDPATSADVPNPAETTEKKTPAEICHTEDDSRAVIDRLHTDLYRLMCTSVSWFDGLFGDRRYEQEYRGTNGSLTMGSLWSQRDSFDKVLRFKAHVYFPQLNNQFHAFIGRSNRDEFIAQSQSELYSLPNQFNRGTDEDVFLGLGYAEPMRKAGSFDADAGVRLQFPLDPYVRGSYRFARPIGEHNLFRFRESIFWENVEAFGTTALIDWDYIFDDQKMMRWSNSATYSQNSFGMRWYSTLTLFHAFNLQRALAYEAAANGETDLQVPLQDYGLTVIFRQRVWRDYLVLELRTGMDWPRANLTETRRSNLNAGLAFELRYGRYY